MKRLAIERLALDLRGVAPATAAAAARLLGPALARALADRALTAATQARLDAGRLALGAAPDAETLAAQLARRIADRTSEG